MAETTACGVDMLTRPRLTGGSQFHSQNHLVPNMSSEWQTDVNVSTSFQMEIVIRILHFNRCVNLCYLFEDVVPLYTAK